MTSLPSDPRPRDPRDPHQPPARGTRGAGYDEAAGAPPGAPATATSGAPATAPASAPAPSSAAVGAVPRSVPTSAVGPRKFAPGQATAPTAVPFPPDDLRAACEALVARYPQRAGALLPILHLAQRRFGGWISPEVEAGVAAYLGMSDQHVRGVLTFYTMFNTKPVGRHHVQVCRTLSCWLRGAGELTRCLERKTGLRPGETDAAGRFTVSEVECLGLCEAAPAVFVNDDEHVHLTPEALEKLLDGLA